ncbi:SAM-dependent DNA methyltransferase [Chitinophaga sp. Cy-1792]|uniref:SAM-dependent DNA methyltransferase n=1 Tax=Chitinophaga sp. Cy-1792 TaxID=2608339 RepID=UPI0014238F78|nr:SAM-dependent DNA methyltransferase [Chitinophaga sp. Cy-1792]NIG56496.1 SAM-dependent DNA methyltransferase [Chitinophaga sp. Cy-1792]
MRTFLMAGLISLAGLIFGCGNAGLNKIGGDIDTSGLYNYCNSFIKAIATKDTTLFYKMVDSDKLVTYFNSKHPQDLISKQELFFPFFFVYSPLKIRKDSLIANRNEELFQMFKISTTANLSGNNVRADVEWTTRLYSARQSISLILIKKDHEWEVVGADWEELQK